MKTFDIQFVCILLLFGSAVEADLRKCGEFDQSEIVRQAVKKYSKPMPFQQEFEEILDAFEKDDNESMEEIFKKLENDTLSYADDEPMNYTENIIKYVVWIKQQCQYYSKKLYFSKNNKSSECVKLI